jgi:predicted glutamine amidotransferase
MCRLLSYVCPAQTPSRAVADVLPSFTAMSAEHKDGWGMAWHAADGVAVVREPAAAIDSARYADVVGSVVTDAALLHLRLATPGIPVAEANSHPFVRDGFAFGHNGFVGPIESVEKMAAPDLQASGSTDSERYFLAVLTRIRAGQRPAHALLDTAVDLLALPETSSANAVLLTADEVHTVCAYVPGREPAGRGTEYFALRYQAGKDAVVVASTGVARDDWAELPNRTVLSIARESRELSILR